MAEFKLKKGYDIKLAGKAGKQISDLPEPDLYAVQPPDFAGIKPKLSVAEGDEVKIGTELFFDKMQPEVKFLSPASGKVKAINRGDRRVITEVVVESDHKDGFIEFTKHSPVEINSITRNEIITQLLNGGLWPLLKQRPFNKIARLGIVPRDIFVNGMNTSPLAADPELLMQGMEEFFKTGLQLLSKLTDGKIHLVLPYSAKGGTSVSVDKVETHYFKGPHPAGNAGVHIHHIAPLNRGEVVWQLRSSDVALIGRFFTEGKYPVERIIAVAGSAVDESNRKYYKTRLGVQADALANPDHLKFKKVRYITGDPLNGRKIDRTGFVGFYDSLLTVLPEKDSRDFLGWISPGLRKESFSRTFLSSLVPRKEYEKDTRLHGGVRAFIQTGEYEKVLPMDILPAHLVKSIIAQDIEEMEKLGLLELSEEDVALCTYICPSKIEFGKYVRQGLDLLESEG